MNWQKGQKFEKLAENYLQKQDYLILERNWHAGLNGEIDLICLKDNIIIFIEVRGRKSGHDDALISINKTKAKKLYTSIQIYVQKLEQEKLIEFENIRFDIITLSEDNLKHLKNIALIDYLE